MTTSRKISLAVNGVEHEVIVEPRLLLSDLLRRDLGLTGTHIGCEHGVCGACTVLVNGDAVRSCIMLAIQARGTSVVTIEGAARAYPKEFPALQKAFTACHALQCGYCTPGFLISAFAFLRDHPHPASARGDEIRQALSGNLCRCTGYQNIVRAVGEAAQAFGQAQKQ